MSNSKKNARKLSKFAGLSFIVILAVFAALVGNALIKNMFGMHCVGLMGSSDCVSEVIFSPIVFFGFPIAFVMVALIEIFYISKEMK